MKKLGAGKAREMLHDGTVHGKAITKKQRGFFGAVARGQSTKAAPKPKKKSRRAAGLAALEAGAAF